MIFNFKEVEQIVKTLGNQKKVKKITLGGVWDCLTLILHSKNKPSLPSPYRIVCADELSINTWKISIRKD